MKELLIGASLRTRRVFHAMCWAGLVVSTLVLSPFPLHALSGFADRFRGLFPHLSRSWEDSPWSY